MNGNKLFSMKKQMCLLGLVGNLVFAFPLFSQSRWSFELYGGGVYNARLPLVIKQNGYPEIRINKAIYHSEPFNDPFYMGGRISKWFDDKSLELEFLHHKLYLINKPPEVERFSLSHGYNMLTVNHGILFKKIIFRAGLGPLFVHPENTVRGMKYPEGGKYPNLPGHTLTGIVFNLGLAKQFRFGKYFFINAEGKFNASAGKVPIVNGYAKVYNIALQLILGPGVNWKIKE